MQGISSTAGPEIQRVWADVENLQNQLFAIAGHGLFVLGLWLVRKYYLGASWRYMLAITLVVSNVIDMPFTFLTIFDVVRNQYFWLDDGLLTAIPAAMNFVVSTYVMVEMAEPGTEGVTYGLLTTASNLAGPVAGALSNVIFGAFNPSLSEASNYVADSPDFRTEVSNSYILTYGLSFASLLLLPLMPGQKAETQARKANRPRARYYATASVTLLLAAMVYAFTADLMAIIPSTSCLKFAGGPGCEIVHGVAPPPSPPLPGLPPRDERNNPFNDTERAIQRYLNDTINFTLAANGSNVRPNFQEGFPKSGPNLVADAIDLIITNDIRMRS